MPTIAMPEISQKYGGVKVTIPTANIFPPTMREVAAKVGALRGKESLHAKIPMDVGETEKKWIERLNEVSTETIRGADESVEDHVKRLYTPKLDEVRLGLEIINSVGPMFGQSQITEEDYDKVTWQETSAFLYNLLTFCNCHEVAKAYAPKSLV